MVDWTLISQAVEYYKSLGFEYIDTPWMVNSDIAEITSGNRDFHDNVDTNGKTLVGSAEQGFLELAINHQLDSVNYVSCGPCFRIGDHIQNNQDGRHHPYFMKVELFVLCDTIEVAEYAARELVHRAHSFMGQKAKVVQTPTGWDLEINGIEVGSYGARKYENLCWAYGTGLAEPRYSEALATCEGKG